jgi:predicted glycoside hydrolase/deacetylase ChbG (UPF0249 family)
MKYLIVNADDLGADVCRNQGIAEAVAAGIVTSVSVLVNGPAFDDALTCLAAWQGQGVSVGLHLNLSEGCPVGKDHCLLPDDHGFFRGKSSTHNLLMQKGNEKLEGEVSLELEAQIGLLEAKKIRISHLDGHQHVHIFPAVIAAAVRSVQRHGIPWLRIPEEPATILLNASSLTAPDFSCSDHLPDCGDANRDHAEVLCREAARFSRLAAAARPFLNGSGIRATDHFRGLYLKGRISFPRLEELLNDLPDGLTELMVHPGRSPARAFSAPFAAFSNSDREGELAALLDPRFHKHLKEKGVFLTPHPEDRS